MNIENWITKYFAKIEIPKNSLKKAYEELTNKYTAVYPISADPPTWGHADIMYRASKRFHRVYWVIGKNTKKTALFTNEEKIEMMKVYLDHYKISNVIVEPFEGSTVRYAREKKAKFLLRGLRSSSDFQFEYELSVGNRGINKEVETICMFSKPHYATISSTIVRELALLGEKVSQYVHPKVEEIILRTLKKDARK